EGLVYGLRAGRELIEERTKRPITRLVVSGGGAQSDGAMQIAADEVGLAAAARARSGHRCEPQPAAVRTYDALYREVYRPMYGRLVPLYRRIRAITGYPA